MHNPIQQGPANPMLGQINQSQRGQIKQMIRMLKSAGDPNVLLQNAMSQNPRLKSVVEAANGNYKKAFFEMAKIQGVDPNEIISALK